jgi:hypothetical protein
MLFTIAALGVDIGNAVARRTDIQTQADYGAYAAAAKLPMTATNKVGQAVDSEVIDAVVDAMNENQPQDDDRPCWTTDDCVTAADLIDSDMTNGDVRYVSGCASTSIPSCHKTDGLQVLSPENWVEYGLADVIGVDGANVRATATVNVFTGGLRVMPMFAVTGCDYGNQTLADPASGHSTTPVPTLYADADTNTIDLTADTQVLKDSTGTDVEFLVKDSTGNKLRFEGSRWSAARRIGFFRSDDATVAPTFQGPNTPFWLYGVTPETNLNPNPPGTGYTKASPAPNAAVTVELDIPSGVTATEGVWYVRVWQGTDAAGHWSPKDEALPIRVGQSFLQCASDVGSGNFGTLEFPRTDTTPSNDIAVNIAVGLEPPLTPTKHDWAVDNPGSAGECFEGTNGAVISEHNTLRTGTNCLATITGGLAPNDATAGLVTGAAGHIGSLTTAPTTDDPDGSGGCDPDGGSQERNVTIPSNPTFHLNDDTLSCFLLDDTTSLQDLVDPDYAESDPPLLSREIFDSPRFFYVPVFAIQPEFGGSNRYSIIDFRPAFITDELVAPSTTKGVHTASDDNGIVFHSNKIEQLDVIFFNVNTLPNETEDSLIDFLGVGRRIVRMID